MLAFELTARRWSRTGTERGAFGRRPNCRGVARVVAGRDLLGRWVGFTTSSTPTPADTGIDIEAPERLLPK
jgi:hypothetical protein